MENNASTKVVNEESQVLLHFSIALPDGTIRESTRDHRSDESEKKEEKPALFDMRSEQVAPSIKSALLGLQEGDKKQFSVNGDDVFGAATADNVHFFERHQFPSDMELSEGAIIAFDQPNGEAVPGIIRAVEGNSIKVDFNHPFAGKTVIFDVEVVAIH